MQRRRESRASGESFGSPSPATTPRARKLCQFIFRYPRSLATVEPFRPYRYTSKAGDPAKLLTQPYDKISPEMQAKYLAASPYNLVRVILGERKASDGDSDNVYTRAAGHLDHWIREGALAQDAAPALYAYFQEFQVPDSGERLTR